jgi:uncharacterized protein (UPF0332 family)
MGKIDNELDALIQYRVKKARETFDEALDVAKLERWNLAANRLYYTLFHACNALLVAYGLNAKTHSGIIRMVGLNFVSTNKLTSDEGKLLSILYNMRQSGDYDDLFDWDKAQVEPYFKPTLELLNKIISLIENR